jgi:bacteriocin-like protein
MKKISLKRVTETLSDNDLKNILGGECGDEGCGVIYCESNSDCWQGCSYCAWMGNWPRKTCNNYA